MKNVEIIKHINELEQFAQNEQKTIRDDASYQRMNIKATYKIAKNKSVLKAAIEPYSDSLKELISKYNVKFLADGNIDLSAINENKRSDFMKELEELLDIEVDVENDLIKIGIEDFGSTYEISQSDMETLSFMIE